MQRDTARPASKPVYRLLAMSRTSTMQKELNEAGKDGFLLVGFTVGKTEIGGQELAALYADDYAEYRGRARRWPWSP